MEWKNYYREHLHACCYGPPPPARMVDPRPNRAAVLHTADVYVDVNGIVYSTDFNAGLSVMEFMG